MATRGRMTNATNKFLRESKDWLTAEDEPMVQGLRVLAAELDKDFMAATYTQYGVTYRTLLKKKPGPDGEVDPLDQILGGE